MAEAPARPEQRGPVGRRPLKVLALFPPAAAAALLIGHAVVTGQPAPSWNPAEQVLEDFLKGESDGFPRGWQASRSEAMTRQAYVVHREGELNFLKTKGVDSRLRIFKRIAWDPKAYPVVTWRWRARSPITGTEPVAALFISLDQDFFGIPVNTKYIWSPNLAKETVVEGGFFRPAQIVLRNNQDKVGEWIEERVNAYEDFKRIHNHEPAPQAWGISLVTGPGIELDFGGIKLAKQ
jgi:hypothetical protein